MNASSDSKPREISLGLPTSTTGAVQIFEDGLPVAVDVTLYPYVCWHSGVSSSHSTSIGPFESAMRYNEINYYVHSFSRTGIGEIYKI